MPDDARHRDAEFALVPDRCLLTSVTRGPTLQPPDGRHQCLPGQCVDQWNAPNRRREASINFEHQRLIDPMTIYPAIPSDNREFGKAGGSMSKSDDSNVASSYVDDSGDIYGSWQLTALSEMGIETSRRFQPWVRPQDVVLDFGCGGGSLLVALSCSERIGMEPNSMPRQEARTKITTVVESLRELDDNRVDVIVSNHALEHSLRPFDDLRELHRICRPGGSIVIITPADNWPRERWTRKGDKNHHLYTWTPLLLGNLMSEAGFRVQSSEILNHAYPKGVRALWRALPTTIFDFTCRVWSALTLQRQVRVIARKNP
jgi:SAM-dependent methyltransferase